MKERFWEVDFMRGAAIIMMIVYHTVFDLSVFGGFTLDVFSGPWKLFARLTASLFIFIAGVSMYLSCSKGGGFGRPFRRGAKIFLIGMMITAFTYIFFRTDAILFGILHLIGLSILLSYSLVRKKRLCLILGIAIIISGLAIGDSARISRGSSG